MFLVGFIVHGELRMHLFGKLIFHVAKVVHFHQKGKKNGHNNCSRLSYHHCWGFSLIVQGFWANHNIWLILLKEWLYHRHIARIERPGLPRLQRPGIGRPFQRYSPHRSVVCQSTFTLVPLLLLLSLLLVLKLPGIHFLFRIMLQLQNQ